MRQLIERVRQNLLDPNSEHRKIVLGFMWVGLFVLIGKVASAAKEMTVAWRYGVSATVDAYVFIMSLINWPVGIWASILMVVLVPWVSRLRKQNPDELPRIRAELLGLTILLGLALGVVTWLGLPPLLQAGWLGLSGPPLQEGLRMVPGLALLGPIGMVSSLFFASLLADGHHRNTLFEAIPAFTLMAFLLLPPGWIPEALVWGTVAGFALNLAALTVPLQRNGQLSAIAFSQRSPEWRFFWGGIGIMAMGQALASLTNVVDQFFAAGLDIGALSMLGYANRILSLLTGLGAMAISRATLPVFSDAYVKGAGHVNAMANFWAKLMFLAGLMVVPVGWVVAPGLVAVLFERGAFTAQDTAAVANLLRICLLQLPFYFPALVLVSALAATGRHKWIAISGAANFFIKIPLVFFLVSVWKLGGLVFSTAIVYAISLVLLYFFMRISPIKTLVTNT